MRVATSLGPNKAIAVACQEIGRLSRESIAAGNEPWQVWDVRVIDEGEMEAVPSDTYLDPWED